MKKNFFNIMMLAVLAMCSTFVACSDDDDNKEAKSATELSGSIYATKTLDASVEYLISGPVIVEDGGVLDIPAGTVIKSKKGFSNYILVLQGGKIYARGTAEKPVKMTADDANAATNGYWGGLIINGKAPLSGGTTGSTEVNSAYIYGGTVADDNSGSLTYLILEYTGARSSADVEHNGLTLNGVGSGTVIENIYVPNGADDGIEFFGGTVNVKNLLVVNPDDDMFDLTQGWSGTLENAYGIWETGYTSTESDPRGVEADGNLDGKNPAYTGQSNFTIKNMTIELRLAKSGNTTTTDVSDKMQDVLKIRRGAKATITNALVKGTGTVIDLMDFTDGSGAGDVTSSISITNSLSNTILGKELNATSGYTYPDATIVSGNTGCATSVFGWTGYAF